ncbi:UDP-N-acetylglucosamine 4,6-dehydratase [Bacillus thuringiensis serovar yunnanensis]|nr:UDP-N-acetylglucosamine 4,6-dehydratase [Bacillus thuringiensis serovar yunnanensis]
MKNKTVLVTGGTGSWGHELVKQLLETNVKEVRIYSRNESLQFKMQKQFKDNKRLTFIIGDIRDSEQLTNACRGVDYIFHLAALKHVPICEFYPSEAMKTNVEGTKNVITAATYNQVEKVIYVSTDKAADPSNTYGMTKALGERFIIQANVKQTNTKFICVRAGNVLGTAGSVVPLFKKQIEEDSQITLTDRHMTRFFLTVESAIKLLFKVIKEGQGGEIFVTKMPACKIQDLAEVLIEDSGRTKIQINELGIRPGEKLTEILLSEEESRASKHFDEDYFVILPTIPIAGLQEHYTEYTPLGIGGYRSDQELISKDEVRYLLKQGGFIS